MLETILKCHRYLDKIFLQEITDMIISYMKEPFMQIHILDKKQRRECYNETHELWRIDYGGCILGDICSDKHHIKKFMRGLMYNQPVSIQLHNLCHYGQHDFAYNNSTKVYKHRMIGYFWNNSEYTAFGIEKKITPNEKKGNMCGIKTIHRSLVW